VTTQFRRRLTSAGASRWSWLCPWAAVALAAAVLALWGLAWWSALLAALLLVCPALLLWGLFVVRLDPLTASEPAPATHGILMNWAAPFYDGGCRAMGLGRGFRLETLEHAALRAGERVLDVGCGTGVLTRLAAEAVGPTGQVLGIDPSRRMIAVARRNAERTGSRAEFRLAAVEALPFAEASFDAVLASAMLHHLPPELKRSGLAEVYRMLRPGGRLLAVDIDRPANRLWWLLIWPLRLMPETAPNLRGEVPAYLREAGFERIEVRGRRAGWLSYWLAFKPQA